MTYNKTRIAKIVLDGQGGATVGDILYEAISRCIANKTNVEVTVNGKTYRYVYNDIIIGYEIIKES